MAKQKRCSPCELSAALGLAFGVCDIKLKKEVDCKKLEDQLVDGKIRKETVFKTLHAAAISAGQKDVANDIKKAASFIDVKV